LLLEVEPPKPLKCQGDAMLERPQNFEKARIEQQISESMLSQLYLIENEKRNPRSAEAFHPDHGKTRRLAVEFAGNIYLDIGRNWALMGNVLSIFPRMN
jgi:hypothetical protein